jgi:GNAT superfamily N-acetyltransferase
MADYPQHLVRQRTLFDGTPVAIRPIRADDRGMEQDFVRHLSDDSRHFRFMSSLRELPPNKLKAFTEIDYDRHMAFIGTIVQDGKEVEIGAARYSACNKAGTCEFAIAVDDAWQGSGVAGLLMIALEDAARAHGFTVMEGMVLATNHKMLKFARQLGFKTHRNPDELETVGIELQL